MDNPILLISLMCLCFPGILPIVATFFIARNYDLSVKKRAVKTTQQEIDI